MISSAEVTSCNRSRRRRHRRLDRDQLEAEAKSLKGKLTLGTISVVCALGYLDFRFASHDWRGKHPKLAKWFAAASKSPSSAPSIFFSWPLVHSALGPLGPSLRTAAKHNAVHVGVYASVLQAGRVRRGDSIRLV